MDIEALQLLEKSATPAPWEWNLNLKHKQVSLEGQTRGRETILEPVRWGMGGARFRFFKDGLMENCEDFAVAKHGRDHHKHWCADINHPDAQLITQLRNAAPDLISAANENAELKQKLGVCKETIDRLLDYVSQPPKSNCACHISAPCADCTDYTDLREVLETANSLIAQATPQKKVES